MRAFKRFLLYLILFLLVLFGILYVAVNSSYVFDKVAGYFAPQYNLRYDKVRGNALTGITLEGLYYKEKKLAREIKIKINPATLLEKKITVSHLTLHGVNEAYLETMISEFSEEDEENSSTSFPFSIAVKDAKLTMLPFEISGIKFRQADLRVASIDYAEDAFAFGTLKLLAKTSLGRADIKGRYHGRNLHLSDLYIGNLNTEEIEKLLAEEASSSTESNTTEAESPSIFMPKALFVQRFKATVLPRTYQGVFLSMLTIDGQTLDVDLDQSRWSGDLNLSLVTDIARAEAELSASSDEIVCKQILLTDLNLSRVLTLVGSEENQSVEVNSSITPVTVQREGEENQSIPFVPSLIKVDLLEAKLLPTVYAGIDLKVLVLRGSGLRIDIPHKILKEGNVTLKADSSIATLTHQGTIKNNTFRSHSELTLLDKLIDTYTLPLRKGAISTVLIDGVTDAHGTQMQFSLSAKQLLESSKDASKDAFNLDIDHALLSAKYLFDTAILEGGIEANISTSYTENAMLDMQFERKDSLQYKGTLNTEKIREIDPKLAVLLKRVSIAFDGTLNTVNATIDSDTLQGTFHSKDLQKGVLHVESKRDIIVSGIVKLPDALRQTRVKLSADLPVDFNRTFPLYAKVKLLSNVIDMEGDIVYGDTLKLRADATIPAKTLLKGFDKSIKFAALSPMKIALDMVGEDIDAKLASKSLKIETRYNLKSGATKGDINLAGTHLSVQGASQKKIALTLNSRSIKTLLKAVNSIYKVDMPDVSGNVSLKAEIKDLKSATLSVQSQEILVGRDKKTGTKISNLSLTAKGDASGVSLTHYRLETQGVKLYATKPSKVLLKGDRVEVSPFWINDMLKTTGTYNLKTKKGTLSSQASALKISHDLADIIASLGIKTRLNGDRTAVEGKVHLKGGVIKYDMNQKSFAADSDIIILQRQRKKNNSFEKHMYINVAVDSSKPLVYKMKNINIKLTPNLTIKKRYGASLKVYGKVVLMQGGYYIFEGKKFVLQKSTIHFKGKPTAPILNINIVYKHAGTTIHVKVSGTAAEPSLHFSSDPHMSREQILSFIMFDTGSGGGENKAGDVTNLVAGTLVKSLFANMGLKLDHLVLTGAGFEVGKKISDKITIIYDQEKKSSIKVRIENTKNIETDISFGTNSRSADIFYKREF